MDSKMRPFLFLFHLAAVGCVSEGQNIYVTLEEAPFRAEEPFWSANTTETSEVPLLNENDELVKSTQVASGALNNHSIWDEGNENATEGQTTAEETWEWSKSTPRIDLLTSHHSTLSEAATFPSDEGSGGTSLEITGSTTVIETAKPTVIPHSCFFNPCNSTHLKIYAKTVILAPKGSNITIACKIENDEESDLHWYRMNGSEFNFRTSAKNQSTLNLVFSDMQLTDSGLYSCAQKTDVSCCRAEVRLKVYVVPNYKRHLMIIGAVALVCFVVCTLFSVWWNKKKLKKYAKQYKKSKNTKKTELLLA